MAIKLTKDYLDKKKCQWINECGDKLNDIELLEEFKGNSTPIKMRCKKCGHIFLKTPYDFKRSWNGSCHNCDSIRRTKSHDDFINLIKENNPHFNNFIIGPYVNKRTKIDVECKICGHKWSTYSSVLYSGANCPNCNRGRLKTHEQFVNELGEINKDIELLEPYINDSTKIKVRCKKCGNTWMIKPNTLLNGHGCSKCKVKHLERVVIYNLENENRLEVQKTFEWLKTSKNGMMKLDIYLPDINIAIECQGEQHFTPVDFAGRGESWAKEMFQKNLKNDLLKFNRCVENDVELLYFTSEVVYKKHNLKSEIYNGLYNNIFTDINELKKYINERKK